MTTTLRVKLVQMLGPWEGTALSAMTVGSLLWNAINTGWCVYVLRVLLKHYGFIE